MEVTPIGWVFLIIGPLLMVVEPAWLYLVAIFFLPFTATEVANVGSDLNASGIQASMFLGSLLILRHTLSIVWRMSFWLPTRGRKTILLLGTFVATTGLSLAMPVWIDGRVRIPAANLGDLSSTPLYLKSSNITGFLYMVFGFAFAYYIAKTNQGSRIIRVTLKAFLAGSIFAALWGLLELACKVSGIQYPAMIFNNGKAASTLGYLEFLTGDVFRLSSVSVEPSIFAQTLLVAVSLYLPFVLGRLRLFGKILDRVLFGLLVIVLFLTTSSTAYIGAAFIIVLILLLSGVTGILRVRHVVLPLFGITATAGLYATVPVIRQVLDTALFSKAGNYSAAERLMTISNSYEMFLKYPILGIGWASITSHDLIINILANAGLLGLLTFVAAMYALFQCLYRSIMARANSVRLQGLMRLDLGVYVALAVTLATSALSGFLNTFSFFWFVVGLAIAGSTTTVLSREAI